MKDPRKIIMSFLNDKHPGSSWSVSYLHSACCHNFPYRSLIAVLRDMHSAGEVKYVVGRRGKKTRVVVLVKKRTLSDALQMRMRKLLLLSDCVMGEVSGLLTGSDLDDATAQELLTHCRDLNKAARGILDVGNR